MISLPFVRALLVVLGTFYAIWMGIGSTMPIDKAISPLASAKYCLRVVPVNILCARLSYVFGDSSI